MEYFEVYDEETGNTLFIKAEDLNSAITISETLDYNDYDDGEYIDTKMRVIEMYIGVGTCDSGYWFTDNIAIPIDTPGEEIERVSKRILNNQLMEQDISAAICGVYAIPLLDE